MNIHWPQADWQSIAATDVGWSHDALHAVGEYLRGHNTSEWMLLHRGRVVRHEVVDDSDVSSDVYAVQKSVLAILVGVAIDRRLLQVDDSINKYLPAGWTQTAPEFEARLTLRHLLTMTTGMTDELTPEGEPGRDWRYNNTAYNYLKRILCEMTDLDLQSLTMSWLGEKIGWRESRWLEREQVLPDGRPFTGLLMSGADMARLGLLVLGEGAWDGERVVRDRAYWQAMFTPGSQANPAWGYYWWRNDQPHHIFPFIDRSFAGPVVPEAPADMCMAMGAMDNRVYVLPSRQLVCVRRGAKALEPGVRGSFDRQLWALLSRCWDG
ncbi:MAG: serine hydrolase domain-containing protein [Pseudomonadota bacterium]